MSASEPEKRPRWGLLGAGNITNDFSIGLLLNGSSIAAVAARDSARAQSFATKVGASRAYGSYDELVQDADVDVVYVGTVHTMHFDHVKLALEAGKHVVCEKPLGVNETQVRELVNLAQTKKLFLMEAMWSRFFPAVRKARELLSAGELGVPKAMQGDFGFVADPSTMRYWDPAQAGGAMLDIGIYLVQAATMVFGATVPEQIACTGLLSESGVDAEGSLALSWKGKGSASLLQTLNANTPEECLVICSNGYLRLCSPAHCPTRLVVARGEGRGKFVEETFEFELPTCPDGHKANFPHSEGMLYEVQAVEKCLSEGQLECAEYTLAESLVVVKVMDTYRKQVGVVYPFES